MCVAGFKGGRGRQSADGRRGHDKEVASSKFNEFSKIDTLFMAKMAKIDTMFMTITAEKPYPLGPHIPM